MKRYLLVSVIATLLLATPASALRRDTAALCHVTAHGSVSIQISEASLYGQTGMGGHFNHGNDYYGECRS